jgi:pyruvate dehydrogenase E1 component beta subunit
MIAEIYGRSTGCAGGKGGSMHLVDESVGFVGSTAIVGGTVPVGVGLAHSLKLAGDGCLACVFLGDAVIETGVFFEATNFAVLKQLPVLFICENNLYSVYSPLAVRQPEGREIHELVRGLGLSTSHGDGNDPEAVSDLVAAAVASIRGGGGPWFIEFATYRWLEHCGPNYDNDLGYRTEAEYLDWRERDPVATYRNALISRGDLTEQDLEAIAYDIEAEVADAFDFALSSPFPLPERAFTDLYATEHRSECADEAPMGNTSITTYASAIRDGFAEAMSADERVVCFGLGADDPRGIFGTTVGLQDRFGSDRVFDMPTSENGMTGVAVGMSLNGLRPVMSHQRMDFALLSADQLVNNAAKWRFMFGGQRGVPLVVRMVIGRGWGQGPTHSQNLQAWFAHVPGLKVVMPATAYDAKGLLLASINDDDPVVFLEHRWLHHTTSEVPEGYYEVPIGQSRTVCEGDAVTVVSASYMTVEALRAVDHLREQGIHCDLIDLRTLRPIDWQGIEASVRRTGRLLALDSGTLTGSIAGEIVAKISESCWNNLVVAPRRLAMPDFPEATSPALTAHYHVRSAHIADVIGEMVSVRVDTESLQLAEDAPHDVPGNWFTGPF